MEDKIFVGKVVKEPRGRGIGRLPCGFGNHEVFYNMSNVGKGNSESGAKIFKE